MERVEKALARIEAAAARIEAVPRAPAGANSELVNKHEELRATVEATLGDLDTLIGTLET